MPVTYTIIASNVLSSTATSVTFSSIPNTYTDLVVRWSTRASAGGNTVDQINWTTNSNTANYSNTYIFGDGSSAGTNRFSNFASIRNNRGYNGSASTANTFSNNEIYIPNYTANLSKPIYWTNVIENNGSFANIDSNAALDRNTSAITSITLTAQNPFAINSSFYLYGIKNS